MFAEGAACNQDRWIVREAVLPAVSVARRGKTLVANGADGISDKDGKAASGSHLATSVAISRIGAILSDV
jgi:hypothetical protein